MDHLHLTRRGRLAVLISAVALLWALAGPGVSLAKGEGHQARVLAGLGATSPDDGPPLTVLVPGDEEARDGELLQDIAWVGIALLLSAGAFGLGRILPRRAREDRVVDVKRLWRDEAETTLPDPERPCLWACKVKVNAESTRSWEIKRIVLVPLPVSESQGAGPGVVDDPKLLAPLNDLEALAAVLGRDSVVEDRLALLTHALVARAMTWSQDGCAPAAFRVDVEVAVPILGRYELYQSRAGRSGLTWDKPRLTWDDPAPQPEGTTLGLFLGPKATELDYPGRLQEELGAGLLRFVQTARWME